MPTFKTQALILNKRPLKDADRLYVLYTKDYGKIEAKVKSAASSKSKLAGHLEPMSLSQVMIVKGRGMETIAGAQLIERFTFSDIRLQPLTALAAEMVIKFVKPGLPDIRIYKLLLAFLNSLTNSINNLDEHRLLTLRFIWRFLSLLGYQIDPEQKEFTGFSSLSKESRQLLNNCLKEKAQLTIFRASSKVVKELVDFTKEYLRYFAESDFRSYNYLRMYE